MSRDDFVIATCKVFTSTLTIVLSVWFLPVSVAGIVLQPIGGTSLLTIPQNGVQDDVQIQLLSGGSYVSPNPVGTFSGLFYNQPVSKLWISTNGNLNFDGKDSFVTESFKNLSRDDKRVVAPFWDDFIFFDDPQNQILNHSMPGSYLAITWKDTFLSLDTVAGDPLLDSQRITTQVVWFEKEMRLPGSDFVFHKDDIAFGYSGNPNGSIFATIGVSQGTQDGMFTGILGGDNGIISSSLGQNNLIPWGANEFLLFRPNANGNSYGVSRESITAVPEPRSIWLVIGWVALAIVKWRRRILERMVIRRTI